MDFDWDSLGDFSELLDVRSPAEYHVDHIPAAINFPVLDDGQRTEVGLLYKQDSFAGRCRGMQHVAANLAMLAERYLHDKKADWRPLVYCWRGGMRSSSVVEVLRKVGWQAAALPGGYKAYRQHVRSCLAKLPRLMHLHVLCGPTGSGKTLLLGELAKLGAQVVDLEALANHRGSMFGWCGPQPTQKSFEGGLCACLRGLDPHRPTFIESESQAIGKLQVPQDLLCAMRVGKVVVVQASLAERAHLTARDYATLASTGEFREVMAKLARYVGKEQVQEWLRLHAAGHLEQLASSLLAKHYDRKYASSLGKHYDYDASVATIEVKPVEIDSVRQAARSILAQCG